MNINTSTPSARAREALAWEGKFLETLRATGNVSASARAVGLDRTAVYQHRARHRDFAKSWQDAVEEATDTLEAEARRRALEGTSKPVYQGGCHVGDVQEYSDTLMITLLKAHRPEKYRERFQGTIDGNLNFSFAQLIGIAKKKDDEPPDDEGSSGAVSP